MDRLLHWAWSTVGVTVVNFGVLFLIITLYATIISNIHAWQKIPIRSQWVLCLPLICFALVITNILSGLFSQTVIFTFFRDTSFRDSAIKSLSPLFVSLLAVPICSFVIFHLMPKNQHWLIGAWFCVSFPLLSGMHIVSATSGEIQFFSFVAAVIYLTNLALCFAYYKKLAVENSRLPESPFDCYSSFFKKGA